MRWFGRATLLGVVVLGLIGGMPRAGAQGDVTITVSAASDLTPAFEELGALFEEQTGIDIDFNFGSTGQIAEQIESGAPVDVFAAANISYVDDLEAQGLIIPDTKAVYGRGRIVVFNRDGIATEITDLTQLTDPAVERIAIANPDHAPYGVAARDALQSAGVWDAVQDKMVLGGNVSDTLRYAETGDVDVAIVALSLAIQGDGQWTLVPEDLHEPIDQALAVIAGTEHEPEARAFATFVNSEDGRAVMRSYGFVLPGELLPGTPEAATPPAATPSASPTT